MSVHAHAEPNVASSPRSSCATATTGRVLQRKCACGGAAGVTGECEACRKKRLALQTKLAVNEPGDVYEQEADRVANDVLSRPASPLVTSAPPRIQRLSGQTSGQIDAAPASVDRVLASPGRPLDAALRHDMEQRFGHDFSRVRVHTDAAAAQSARDVNAHAYTVGHRIVFDGGQFVPNTRDGRRLLAHELTHVVQQDSELMAPRIQRKSKTYTVKPDHAPMSAEEVLILMAMTSRKVSREAAIKLIENDEYGCGEHPACVKGVSDTTPIEFTIGVPEPKKSAPKAAAPDPHTEAGSGPVVVLPAEIESALKDPHVKRFFAVGTQHGYFKLPAAPPNHDEYASVNYIRDAVMRLSGEELLCYQGFAAGSTIATWTDVAKSLNEFNTLKAEWCHAGEHPDPAPRERLRGTDALYAAIKEREETESLVATLKLGTEGGASRVPHAMMKRLLDAKAAEARELSKAGFATLDDFDRAANEFRLYFRAIAITVAQRMLFESGRVLQDAVRRYQLRGDRVSRDCQELYDELYGYGGRTVDQLKDAHPILRNPGALKAVSRARNVYEFSWRLSLYAHERLRDLGFVQKNLKRAPDVVFRFDVVVERTLADLGLGNDSIFASVIRDQRGKPSSSLGEKIVRIGIEVLLFALHFIAPPVGAAISMTRAVASTIAEGSEYEAGMREVDLGVREKEPSITPVFVPLVAEAVPIVISRGIKYVKRAHDAAKAEKLVATDAAERKLAESAEVPDAPAPHVGTPEPVPRPTTTPPTTNVDSRNPVFWQETQPTMNPTVGRLEVGKSGVTDLSSVRRPPTSQPPITIVANDNVRVVDVRKVVNQRQPPQVSAPKVTPVVPRPASHVPTADAPTVIKSEARLAQAEEHLPTTQAKAEPMLPQSSLNDEIANLEKQRARVSADASKAWDAARSAKRKLSRNQPVSQQEQALIDEHNRLMAARADIDDALALKKRERTSVTPPFKSPAHRAVWTAREKQAEQLLTDIAGKENVFVKPKIARVGKADLPLNLNQPSLTTRERYRLGLSSNEVTPEFGVRLNDGSVVMVDVKGAGKHSWTKQKYVYAGLEKDGVGVVVVGRPGLPAGSVVDGKVVLLGPDELSRLAASPTIKTLMELLGR